MLLGEKSTKVTDGTSVATHTVPTRILGLAPDGSTYTDRESGHFGERCRAIRRPTRRVLRAGRGESHRGSSDTPRSYAPDHVFCRLPTHVCDGCECGGSSSRGSHICCQRSRAGFFLTCCLRVGRTLPQGRYSPRIWQLTLQQQPVNVDSSRRSRLRLVDLHGDPDICCLRMSRSSALRTAGGAARCSRCWRQYAWCKWHCHHFTNLAWRSQASSTCLCGARTQTPSPLLYDPFDP